MLLQRRPTLSVSCRVPGDKSRDNCITTSTNAPGSRAVLRSLRTLTDTVTKSLTAGKQLAEGFFSDHTQT